MFSASIFVILFKISSNNNLLNQILPKKIHNAIIIWLKNKQNYGLTHYLQSILCFMNFVFSILTLSAKLHMQTVKCRTVHSFRDVICFTLLKIHSHDIIVIFVVC